MAEHEPQYVTPRQLYNAMGSLALGLLAVMIAMLVWFHGMIDSRLDNMGVAIKDLVAPAVLDRAPVLPAEASPDDADSSRSHAPASFRLASTWRDTGRYRNS